MFTRLSSRLSLRLTLRPTSRLALLLTSLSLLTACGFHLRGDIDLPPALAQVHIIGADRDLVDLLTNALQQNGARVTDTQADATVITVTTSRFQRNTLATDSAGLASVYRVDYQVTFTVTDHTAQTITQQRTYNYDPTQQLQSEQEERFLQTEMQREVVMQIVRRLTSITR